MRLKTEATQVALRTATLLKNSGLSPIFEPTWYKVILANPPTHQILPKVRQLESALTSRDKIKGKKTADGFYVTRNKLPRDKSSRRLYKLPVITYIEDKIREMFYTNHPWELARPRNMIENGSNKNTIISRLDWSSMVQPSLPLNGENVVQRTLWLSKQKEYVSLHGEDWFQAYEQARLEFYKLRMREYIDRQVAEEEALMHGSVFGPTSWESTIKREQEIIEQFIPEAVEASKVLEAKRTKVVSE